MLAYLCMLTVFGIFGNKWESRKIGTDLLQIGTDLLQIGTDLLQIGMGLLQIVTTAREIQV